MRPDIKVTTTHSYEIAFKYRWKCVDESCGKMFASFLPPSFSSASTDDIHITSRFQRHSNSIAIDTHGCPCGSPLAPVDQDGKFKAMRIPAKKSAWQDFLTVSSALSLVLPF